ncbi:hypothetical protein MPTK1_6g13950 [Marchantia polymorpha subsp. ruderalis]|uniref:Uncharacterized protein n=2 Tax=Marchantia polymorpha TaxID=3197 RepID=A0A176W429_MARPO|nr:hypothetical protein AXG93_2015s1320 [Marchantia polymorpha subsp. ruderalis]PTQ39065.1 hypothetical protein MARPO_0047s0047 [Marchantia polymorpha]BBN14726.1 hypothetical protein Mp_6g13950 [Marchantia polymorpha subsp. ruderalis]|eukprot:PTQ39065.1 hypothetical protein MARPO_0047s0047 [Marchantia polymorpha]
MPRGSAPPWRQKPTTKDEKVGASTSETSVPPWRQPAKPKELKHSALSMKATNDPGGKGKMMYAPPAGTGLRNDPEKDSMFELDPQLKMAFQRNFQFIRRVFSFDTLFKPLPRPIANTLAHNFGFLTRIFTQFFDPRGIQNVQRSIGLGQEQGERKVK